MNVVLVYNQALGKSTDRCSLHLCVLTSSDLKRNFLIFSHFTSFGGFFCKFFLYIFVFQFSSLFKSLVKRF